MIAAVALVSIVALVVGWKVDWFLAIGGWIIVVGLLIIPLSIARHAARVEDACRAACAVADHPMAESDRYGACWCYESASKKVQVEVAP